MGEAARVRDVNAFAARMPPPLVALVVTLVLFGLALLMAPTAVWLDAAVLDPLRAQADPPAERSGYSTMSLAFWAAVGGVLAWNAYHLLFVRWRVAFDGRFLLGLAPLFVFGPLFHALLRAGVVPQGTLWAWLAAEPVVYLSTALVGVAGLAAGRLVGRPHDGLMLAGIVALAPLLVAAADVVSVEGAWRGAAILGLAALGTAVALAVGRPAWRRVSAPAAAAVIGAHALDGASTWLGIRDPFGWGFPQFSESNPLSERLVMLQNGWPFFAVKLALPLVLLALVKPDEDEEGMYRFLLLAVFVLGYGPGMSNLLQMLLA